MTLQGIVVNGVIVPEGTGVLPEGAKVTIVLPQESRRDETPDDENLPSLYESLKPFIGCLEGLPSDFAAEHDHYIHGTPKRS